MKKSSVPRLLAAAALVGLAAACADDPLTEEVGDAVTATVTGPTAVSAVVIDFSGVASIDVEGGDVFTSQVETGLRAVIVLHTPGELKLTLEPSFPASMPSATLVDVADDGYQAANPEAYDVVLGS